MSKNFAPQSDYMMQNAVLRDMSTPAGGTNAPQTADTLNAWAANKSAANADDIRFTQGLAQKQKQFLTTVLDAHKKLDTWKKQNTIATLISGATIPVQGYASYKAIGKADEAAARTQEQINSNKSLMEAMQEAQLAQATRHNQALQLR